VSVNRTWLQSFLLVKVVQKIASMFGSISQVFTIGNYKELR